MCKQSDLAHPLSGHTMIIHFRSYEPDPSLDLINHPPLMCILNSDQENHKKRITCIFSFDLTLHRILIPCALIPLIFSYLYSFSLSQCIRAKQN